MHHNLSTSLVLLTCCAPVAAQTQTTIIPKMYATAPGVSGTAWPFGLGTATRNQEHYAASVIAAPTMVIKQIAIRGMPTAITAAKSGVDLEIGMTTTPVDPWRASTTFASNLGADYKLVFTRKSVNLPAQPGGNPTPPFVTMFPLDSQFVYIGGNLLIDYLVYAQPVGTYSHDAGFTNVTAMITANGTPCSGLSQAVVGAAGTATTSTATFNLSGAPTGGMAFHALGAGLLPTPLPLPFGGCLLYQDAVVVSQVAVTGTTASFVYPLFSTFKGITVYGQGFAVDSGLTTISASQSHQVVIGGYDPICRIYNNTSVTSATGSTQVGVGIVTELTY